MITQNHFSRHTKLVRTVETFRPSRPAWTFYGAEAVQGLRVAVLDLPPIVTRADLLDKPPLLTFSTSSPPAGEAERQTRRGLP
jgi:hypothetical protein